VAIPTASGRGGRLAVVGALLAISVAMAACGGADSKQKESPVGSAAGSDRQAAAGAASRGGATIEMADLRFRPADLTVARGELVTFQNVGKVTHNAKGKTFFSRVVEPGGSYRQTFTESGTFEFVCTFHPGMEGRLTVQ